MKRITLFLLVIFAGFIAYSQSSGMTEAEKLRMLNMKPAAEAEAPVVFKSGASSVLPGVPQAVKPLLWQELDHAKAAPEWIHWDSGVNYDAIGTGGASDFMVAARFTPEDLVEYAGTAITRINFVPYVAVGTATYTLKVWQGTTPPTEVYSQDVSSVNIEQWNDIELTEAVPIDASQELWVGYHVVTSSGYPAGCDAGPQVAGKGNNVYWAGEWQLLTDLNPDLTYNWNIQAFVETMADPGAPAAPLSLVATPGAAGAMSVTLNWNNPALTFGGATLTDLDNVFVYRGAELIHTIANPTIGAAETFVDNTLTEAGIAVYSVYGANDLGDGPGASAVVFVGPDVPAAPGDVVLAAQGNNGYVTWAAPTEGLNGGYLNPAGITYTVVRMPDAVEVAADITALEYTDATVPGIGNYYYVVTASNDLGEGGSAASNVTLLGAEGVLMYEVFDYATGALPPGWTVEGLGQTNWSVYAGANAGGTTPELRLYWSPAFNGLSRLISYPIDVEGYEALRLKYKQYLSNYSVNEGEIAAIDVSYDGGTTWTPIWEYEIIDNIPAGDYELYLDIPAGATELHLSIRFDGNVYNINNWYIDNIILEPVLEHDLVAVSISGNTTPSAGVETIYNVAVQNAGTVTASNYTVKLMKAGGVELASVAGTAIEFGETINFELAWTPDEADEGAQQIYGLVEFTEDEQMGNNQTDLLGVLVQSADIIAVTIGDGDLNLYMPYNFLYENSISQTLYYPEEIGLGGGVITAVQYTSFFNAELQDRNIQIWMGETEMENLSEGWVDPASLQLVFDGTVDFPTGTNDVVIPLDNIYIYGGGNLVIYSHKPDTEWSGSKYFKGANMAGSNRSRRAQQDGTPFDPSAPTAGAANSDYPNTVLFFSTEGLGALEGTVTDGTDALEGVKVSVLGTMSTTLTDADGDYAFPYLLPGTYDIQFELFGYESTIVEDVVILEDETTIQDAVLTSIPQYTISGTIEGNDDLLIEGASVMLEGYDDYMVLTDADGEFSIAGVYAGTYVMTVNAVGYETYVNETLVVSADADLGTIVIDEIIVLPFGLVVDVDNQEAGNALLTWNSGSSSFADSFEDGTFDAWHEFVQGSGQVGDDGGFPYWFATTDVDGMTPPDGSYVARADWGYSIDTWLISPPVVVEAGAGVTFSWYSSYYWSVNPNPNAELMVKISTDGGSTWDEVWNWQNIGVWTNFTWYESTVDLSDYAGQVVHVAFNLTGNDNAVSQIDNVMIGAANKAGTIALSKPVEVAENAKELPAGLKAEKAFTGFNVFLDGTEVASEITETQYLFTDLDEGDYTAGVQSVYTTGDSEIVTVDFSVIFGVPVTVEVTTNSGDDAEGALVVLTNEALPQYTYTATAGADGSVAFASVRKGLYTLTVNLADFDLYEEANIDIQDAVTLEAELVETIVEPYGLSVVEGENAGEQLFSWNNAMGWNESFESGTMPEGWTTVNTNTASGSLPTNWAIMGTIEFSSNNLVPQDGNYQAFLYWDYGHQDEWLITPAFTAPNGDLSFWYYGHNGSVNGDHYYVKVSTDGGDTWTVLWDASTLPEADNHYVTPAVIDLSAYAGQEVHIAWQNIDGDGQGLWYAWALDNITVGDMKIDVKDLIVANEGNVQEGVNLGARDGKFYPSVNPEDMIPAPSKSFEGYNVYLDDMVTPVATDVAVTEFLFTELVDGDYVAGVQSVYTSGASDVITIPFTVTNGIVQETYTVTFNVHMHELADFDPDTDDIYIAGQFPDWVAPGEDPELLMQPTDDPMILTLTLELEAGTYAYKYFRGAGYDGGEWNAGDDREIVVTEDMVVDNVFGNINDPVEVPVVDAGELLVYPNPVRDVMHIVSNEMIREVRIIDLLGQVVYSSAVQGDRHEVNVGGFRNGIYFVQILTPKGLNTQRVQITR